MDINFNGFNMSTAANNRIREITRRLLAPFNFNDTIIYNLNTNHTHEVGSANTPYILFNAATNGMVSGEETIANFTINGHNIGDTLLKLMTNTGDTNYKYLSDDEGRIIAEYNAKWNQINIPFRLIKGSMENNDETNARLKVYEIILEWYAEIQKAKEFIHSWTKSKDKDFILGEINKVFKGTVEAEMRNLRQTVDNNTQSIIDFKRKIVERVKRIEADQHKLLALENTEDNPAEKYVSEMENLISNDKVKDVVFKDGKFQVLTEELHCYDHKGNGWFIGEMTIKIDMMNASVNFFASNGQGSQGYWTGNDPHPHVAGNSGAACLGNVEASIAELCTQKELYALSMICIDFLESVNRGDSAGSKVRNWTLSHNVDFQEHPITSEEEEEGQPDITTCHHCDDQVEEDNTRMAYNAINNLIVVCDDCISNDYAIHDDDEYYDNEHPIWNEEEEEANV